MSEALIVERRGAVAIVTMNLPKKRNALGSAFSTALGRSLTELQDDPDLRALVLHGGAHFCAGGDLQDLNEPLLVMRQAMQRGQRSVRALASGRLASIAAVEGSAFGAGFSLAMACDFVVADAETTFGAVFGKVGLQPDYGLLWSLPQRVGTAMTREIVLFGEPIKGARAKELGLVDRLADSGEVLNTAITLAERLATLPPGTVATTKSILSRQPMPLDTMLAWEADTQALLLATDDFAEGVKAFTERRPAQFQGADMSNSLSTEVPQLRSAADTVPQEWSRLRDYLATQNLQLTITPPPRQFAGGFANLNYLVIIDGKEAVLRRPPLGPLPPGAYDMGRESKILSKLWKGFALAPRALHLCEDPAVLGAPFQLTEYRRGISLRDTLPPALADNAAIGAQLGAMLTDVLAQLHAVDTAAVGLDDLGKPQGFLARTVEGWSKRAGLAVDGWATPGITQLISEIPAWLRAQPLPESRVSFLHNDFKLDNVLLDPETLQPVAVLDWDQGTRGDPLFDLATLLSYWTEPNDPPAMHLMAQMPTTGPGFPTRQQAAAAYARAANVDLSNFQFYRVLATFKTAVIFAQLYARYHAGGTTEPRYARFNELTEGLLVFARDIAHNRSF